VSIGLSTPTVATHIKPRHVFLVRYSVVREAASDVQDDLLGQYSVPEPGAEIWIVSRFPERSQLVILSEHADKISN
jgi:phage gp45-like